MLEELFLFALQKWKFENERFRVKKRIALCHKIFLLLDKTAPETVRLVKKKLTIVLETIRFSDGMVI